MENPIWNKIKNLFFEPKEKSKESKSKKPNETLSFIHWMMIVACLGLGAMILHNFFSINNEVRSPLSIPTTSATNDETTVETLGSGKNEPQTMEDYEELYENQLIDMLTKIVGVGEVSVMVNLDTTEQLVIEKIRNTSSQITSEKDREGGSRQIEDQKSDEQAVTTKKGNEEEPLVIMKKKPKIRGVLVVATGVEHMQVKAMVTEAIQRVLDVPAHKISVLPKRK